MAKTPLDQFGLVNGNALSQTELLAITDALCQRGPTADRPIGARRFDGKLYYDTTAAELIMWNGTAAAWRSMRGKRVSIGGSALTTSGATPLVVNTGTLPATVGSGIWFVAVTLMGTISGAGSQFQLDIDNGASAYGGTRSYANVPGTETVPMNATASVATSGASQTVRTVLTLIGGSGTYTTNSDTRYNRIDGIFIPD